MSDILAVNSFFATLLFFIRVGFRMLTPQQCRAARGGLDWTRAELAERAGVSLSTVANFEQEKRGTYRPNLDAMRRALEEGGARFTEDGCVCFPPQPEASGE